MPESPVTRFTAALVVLIAAACSSKSDSSTAPAVVSTTTVTLGPALATSAYKPSGLNANWSGYCPVGTPSSITITAGNAYQVVNGTDRSLTVIVVGSGATLETIAAGGTGTKHIEYGAVSQPTFTFALSVSGCTDTQSGQGLVNVTVNSK